LTLNTIASYNGGASAGTSCPITRQIYVQQIDNTWLKATDSNAGSGVPTSFGSQTPVLDWFEDYSNEASANTGIGASAAFKVVATFDSSFLGNLFVNNIGRTYNVKMVSFDAYSTSSKN